jgi:hypothetical protein
MRSPCDAKVGVHSINNGQNHRERISYLLKQEFTVLVPLRLIKE